MTGQATARARQKQEVLSIAAEAFAAIECHRISLIPVFDGQAWFASADKLGEKHNKKRAIASVCAHGITSIDAVRALVKKLEEGEKRWD